MLSFVFAGSVLCCLSATANALQRPGWHHSLHANGTSSNVSNPAIPPPPNSSVVLLPAPAGPVEPLPPISAPGVSSSSPVVQQQSSSLVVQHVGEPAKETVLATIPEETITHAGEPVHNPDYYVNYPPGSNQFMGNHPSFAESGMPPMAHPTSGMPPMMHPHPMMSGPMGGPHPGMMPFHPSPFGHPGMGGHMLPPSQSMSNADADESVSTEIHIGRGRSRLGMNRKLEGAVFKRIVEGKPVEIELSHKRRISLTQRRKAGRHGSRILHGKPSNSDLIHGVSAGEGHTGGSSHGAIDHGHPAAGNGQAPVIHHGRPHWRPVGPEVNQTVEATTPLPLPQNQTESTTALPLGMVTTVVTGSPIIASTTLGTNEPNATSSTGLPPASVSSLNETTTILPVQNGTAASQNGPDL